MIGKKKISNYVILTMTFFTLICLSCKKKKDKQQQEAYPIPYTPVSVTIYPNDPSYFKIQSIGGWIYYQGAGVQGLIIYRKTQQDFVALERASPENPNVAASAVKVQSDNFTLRDTVKNARWQIVDGAPMQGTSTWNLRIYGSTYDGNVLRIVN